MGGKLNSLVAILPKKGKPPKKGTNQVLPRKQQLMEGAVMGLLVTGFLFVLAPRENEGCKLEVPFPDPPNGSWGFGVATPFQTFHSGDDWMRPMGTPIVSAGKGTVEWAEWWPRENQPSGTGHGLTVFVRHECGDDEFFTVYAHMSSIEVHVGDHVQMGQQLGAVGMTGAGQNPHLHFAVTRVGPNESRDWTRDWIDPLTFIESHQSAPKNYGVLWKILGWLLLAGAGLLLVSLYFEYRDLNSLFGQLVELVRFSLVPALVLDSIMLLLAFVQAFGGIPKIPTNWQAYFASLRQNDPTCQVSAKFPESVYRWCPLLTSSAREHGLDPNLLAALVLQESGGDPQARSYQGAIGLTQVMPKNGIAAGFMCPAGPCFGDRPSIDQLLNPDFNVRYGTGLLAANLAQTGTMRDALMRYGPAGAGYSYADTVLALYARYK